MSYENYSLFDDFEDERMKGLNDLLNRINETIKCIHFTNAVNYCINLSLENPYNYDGHFDNIGFEEGKYDTEELLNETYENAILFMNTYSDRFDNDFKILEYIKFMNNDENKNKYKYVKGLLKHINGNKELIRRKGR